MEIQTWSESVPWEIPHLSLSGVHQGLVGPFHSWGRTCHGSDWPVYCFLYQAKWIIAWIGQVEEKMQKQSDTSSYKKKIVNNKLLCRHKWCTCLERETLLNNHEETVSPYIPRCNLISKWSNTCFDIKNKQRQSSH